MGETAQQDHKHCPRGDGEGACAREGVSSPTGDSSWPNPTGSQKVRKSQMRCVGATIWGTEQGREDQ